jgi:hypothetical protein
MNTWSNRFYWWGTRKECVRALKLGLVNSMDRVRQVQWFLRRKKIVLERDRHQLTWTMCLFLEIPNVHRLPSMACLIGRQVQARLLFVWYLSRHHTIMTEWREANSMRPDTT